MAPKKTRFKPPIRPNADGTGFVKVPTSGLIASSNSQQRGREGYTEECVNTTKQISSNSIQKINNISNKNEILLNLRLDSALPSNEARLSPSSFKSLGIMSGAVLRIISGNNEAYAEAFLSSLCQSQNIILSDEMASAFNDKQVTVSVLKDISSNILPLSFLIIEISSNSPNGIRSAQSSEKLKIPFLEVRAAFRRQYKRRLVFKGMRTTIRIATQPFYVEVIRCVQNISNNNNNKEQGQEDQSNVLLGILMDGTVIGAEGITNIKENNEIYKEVINSEKDNSLSHNLLVIGEPGTGKSRFLKHEIYNAATILKRHVEIISVEELPQGEMSDISTSTILREALTRAKIAAPSTVLIDDLHLICGSNTNSTVGSLWAMTLIATALGEELDDIRKKEIDVRVIVSAPSVDLLIRSLLTPDRFSKKIVLLTPGTVEERLKCLKTCLEEHNLLNSISDEVKLRIAEEAHGFTQRDISRLVEVAIVENFKSTCQVTISDSSIKEAAKFVRPSALKQFEVSIPNVTWKDIGGSEEAKKTLQDCVSWCLGKQSWIFRAFKLNPPKGVLLYGPPGCSKTMLAKALANESKMNFISVKGPEVFSKWVGDSEKAVRDIFTRARAVAPCVVFIDELDGMCGHRGRGGVSDRVISQFLTELDGLPAALEEAPEALVFVAATNRPDNIDPAVLRPGRIDRKVLVSLPDLGERRAIAAIHFARTPTAPDLDAEFVAQRTEGYSGAEVVAVVKEAAFLRVTADAKAAHITREDIEAALQKVRPRISPQEVEWYKKWSMGSGNSIQE